MVLFTGIGAGAYITGAAETDRRKLPKYCVEGGHCSSTFSSAESRVEKSNIFLSADIFVKTSALIAISS